jgi:hypothetical protein
MRVLRADPSDKRWAPRPSRRINGAAEHEALMGIAPIVDAVLPMLIEAMVRNLHLTLAPGAHGF